MTNPDSLERFISEVAAKLPTSFAGYNKFELEGFLRRFFYRIPVIELERMNVNKGLDVVLKCLDFFSSATEKPAVFVQEIEHFENDVKHKELTIIMVNDDMPFIVDSAVIAIKRCGVQIDSVIHPIIKVKRANGRPSWGAADGEDESLVYISAKAMSASVSEKQVRDALLEVMKVVRSVNDDSKNIRARMMEEAEYLSSNAELYEKKLSVPKTVTAEAEQFIRWLLEGNFVLLGVQDIDFKDVKKEFQAQPVKGSSLGLFREDSGSFRPKGMSGIEPKIRANALKRFPLEVTKSGKVSPVHRDVPMDYVAVKKLDKSGSIIGERRFLGLFSTASQLEHVDAIPIVRHKTARVIERSQFDKDSFDGKNLKRILETYPRDELFAISEERLYDNAMSILALETQTGQVRVFIRKDLYERFTSALIYIPRDRLSTDIRIAIQHMLEDALDATCATFIVHMSDDTHVRISMLLRTKPGEIPEFDIAELEKRILAIVASWEDNLSGLLHAKYSDDMAIGMKATYLQAFPPEYKSLYLPPEAMDDVVLIDKVCQDEGIHLRLYTKESDPEGHARIKVYTPATMNVQLSTVVPVLENMDLKAVYERPFIIKPLNLSAVAVRELFVRTVSGAPINLATSREPFEEALVKILEGEIENDNFNRLILSAGLKWREANILRAMAGYMKQIRFSYSPDYIATVLGVHTEIAKMVVSAFLSKFDPDVNGDRKTLFGGLVVEIEHRLTAISSVDDDRIIRKYVELLNAVTRTNYFKAGGSRAVPRPFLSFKVNPKMIADLPQPKPFAEIFVYSRRFEGVHLRGGKVARGGLRWSDRREDFRTEILGLMKAQMVKNSVIVPTGAKGGFVLKQAAGLARDEFMKEGVECYKNFLRGLLDITDNVIEGNIVRPQSVVSHDEEDPYLVVAADKGTATFSDYANSVSEEYGHWLGDAFASGGSAGYDHKVMGITAKGGWVSVVRHFREMGVDIFREEFTAVGIGDMAGDVFGNGMLLSNKMRLVAAFNHLHIFIDPSPNAEKSFKERERMFKLPRSTWMDYDAKLISKGGGIFERSAKSITLSKEIKELLDIKADSITPDELLRAILTAPVDLLWNGGIGTYVKSSKETNEMVGDKANDAIRINGADLHCKIIGEGGNLGMTQMGRIEYAMNGGRLNTDAIDNSAGVDCSDHEVNIKIGFSASMQSGKLNKQKRDEILSRMTDNVAFLVLRDNQLQTQALTIAETHSAALMDPLQRLMKSLEKTGLLSRRLEYLPSDEDLMARKTAGKGLTRPELAVMLSYSKIAVSHEILSSTLPDDPYFEAELFRYFPQDMQENFKDEISNHKLRREIISTATTNSMVNRAGITFVNQIAEETGQTAAEVARAYALSRDIFDLRNLWGAIEELDGKIDHRHQVEAFNRINGLIYQATLWFLRNYQFPTALTALYEEFAQNIAAIEKALFETMTEAQVEGVKERQADLESKGLPAELSARLALMYKLFSALDIIRSSNTEKGELLRTAKIYFALQDKLSTEFIVTSAAEITRGSHWPRLAAGAMIADVYDELRKITSRIMDRTDDRETAMEGWWQENVAAISRYNAFMEEIKSVSSIEIPMLVMAIKRLQAITSVG